MSATDAPQLKVRQLDRHDIQDVQALLDADSHYARRVTGTAAPPHAAAELLTARPPGLPATHKAVLGAYDDTGVLVAVVDVLRGWPDDHTAHIGLLQTHSAHQGRGIGRRTHELLLEWVARWPEVRRMRATIVATNAMFADEAEAEPWTARSPLRGRWAPVRSTSCCPASASACRQPCATRATSGTTGCGSGSTSRPTASSPGSPAP